MLTTMATGAVADNPAHECTVKCADTAYELVLLRCVVDAVEKVTAVAALVSRGPASRSPNRPQLLAAVAAQLKSDPPALRKRTRRAKQVGP
jgi:hypothetical protein